MAKSSSGRDVALALLRAVGIDSRLVVDVQLTTKLGELTSVTIVRALDAEDVARLAKELEAIGVQP